MTKEELGALEQKIDGLEREYTDAAKALFQASALEIFNKFPALESFSWKQYTPYFNDGDACYFSVETEDFDVNGDSSEELYRYEAGVGRVKEDGVDEGVYAGYLETQSLLQSIKNSVFLSMFGDHAKVTVTREGVKVNEYSHD